jgi:DMSO/TMAO reductase YedYZ molybdopterin-dependent catalytic subunit
MDDNHDPLRPHSHDPNPEPPSADPTFWLALPGRSELPITLETLKRAPRTAVPDCTIVSTGHGVSGPFTFSGVSLLDLINTYETDGCSQVEVVSADGFGNRIAAEELHRPTPAGPILLADEVNGRPLKRSEGLVRLIVPSEQDDALRQVKWVARIRVRR